MFYQLHLSVVLLLEDPGLALTHSLRILPLVYCELHAGVVINEFELSGNIDLYQFKCLYLFKGFNH